MRAILVAALACTSVTAQTRVCSGEPALDALSGYYAHSAIASAAKKMRSWPAILGATDAQTAGLIVKDRNVFRVLAWHEGDAGGHCLDVRGAAVSLIARDDDRVTGPYLRVASLSESESWTYLSLFAGGCYSASNRTRWCISRTGITVDSKPLAAQFVLDTMEQPVYGTNLLVEGSPLPLLVLVPSPNGFRIFKDTWASDPNRRPVDPAHDKPWLTLARQP